MHYATVIMVDGEMTDAQVESLVDEAMSAHCCGLGEETEVVDVTDEALDEYEHGAWLLGERSRPGRETYDAFESFLGGSGYEEREGRIYAERTREDVFADWWQGPSDSPWEFPGGGKRVSFSLAAEMKRCGIDVLEGIRNVILPDGTVLTSRPDYECPEIKCCGSQRLWLDLVDRSRRAREREVLIRSWETIEQRLKLGQSHDLVLFDVHF